LIPADDGPGALVAGTEAYLLRQFSVDGARNADALSAGLAQLDTTARSRYGENSFVALDANRQDTLLTELDTAGDPIFHRLVDLAHEGFYANPASGGNRDGVSWTMLGYDPRTTPPPSPTP
jgi:hypothetical protein